MKYNVKRQEYLPVDMPGNLCDEILAQPRWGLPQLEEIVRNPILAPDGWIVQQDGYRSSLKGWIDLRGYQVDIKEEPSQEEAIVAKDFILEELLHDFPFAERSSLINSLAMGLLPYVRHLINGPTPLHMVMAPVRGSGKTLIVQAFSLISTGNYPENMTEGKDDEEWRKRITSSLLATPTIINIDNINGDMDAASLASVLTSPVWTDRLLGFSKNASIRNNAIWCATANNPKMSSELERRCVYIRLDPNTAEPEKRTGFKHHPLLNWVEKNRKELLTKFLTIIKYWSNIGMPKAPSYCLASFEAWSSLMAGILHCVGEADGFLANRDKYKISADMESREWETFVEVWWEAYQESPVGVADLRALAKEEEIMDRVMGSKSEISQKNRLTHALKKNEGRVWGKYRIRFDQSGRTIGFYLEPVSD